METSNVMPRNRTDPNEFLPLSNLSFHVLLALGAGPSHGYAVGKDSISSVPPAGPKMSVESKPLSGLHTRPYTIGH